MSYNLGPIKPFSKRGKRTLHIVTLTSFLLFLPCAIFQSMLGFIPGIVFFLSLWAELGRFLNDLWWEKEEHRFDGMSVEDVVRIYKP